MSVIEYIVRRYLIASRYSFVLGRRKKKAPFGTPIIPNLNSSSDKKYSTMASIEEKSFYAQHRDVEFTSEVGGTVEEEEDEQQDWEQRSEELL